MSRVTIIDYGLCNILSVTRGFESVGAEVELTDSAAAIDRAERLVLPGVGAFADGMAGLREKGLVEPLREYAKSGRPLIGVCLGMQMLLETNEEFGIHEGLGLIPGRVVAIPGTDADGRAHKIPHIGWTDLVPPEGTTPESWKKTVFKEIRPGTAAYFVHSYTAVTTNRANRLADSYYGGQLISAAVYSGNVYGCQFHPEKSGPIGLSILKSFMELR